MMICGNCDYNDGCIYTSNPPKYRCTFTGDFHFGNEPCKVGLVPVVRCKDCRYLKTGENERESWSICARVIVYPYLDVGPNDYCSYGERESDERIHSQN